MEEVALEGLRRWKSAQESNLDVALCLPYLSVLSKNPCCCERVVDEMMAALLVGLDVTCPPHPTVFALLRELSHKLSPMYVKYSGVFTRILTHLRREQASLDDCNAMKEAFLALANANRDAYAFHCKYWNDAGCPFVVAFKVALETHAKNSCRFIQEFDLVHSMALDLRPLFCTFFEGIEWLEAFRVQVLVSASVLVATSDVRCSWEGLLMFLQRLMRPVYGIRETYSEHEACAMNRFFQVSQQAVLRKLASSSRNPLATPVHDILAHLFLKDAVAGSFFMRHGVCAFASPEAVEIGGTAFFIPPSGASQLFLSNASLFYTSGGFDALLHRLESTQKLTLSIAEVSAYVHVFKTCKWCVTLLWLHKYLERFFQSVRVRLQNPSPLDFLCFDQKGRVSDVVREMNLLKADCVKTYSIQIALAQSNRDEVGTAAFVAMVGRVKTPMWIKELSHFDEIEIFKEIAAFKEKHDRWILRSAFIKQCFNLA